MKPSIVAETSYAFRGRMDTLHHRGRRDHGLTPLANECCLRDGWSIGVAAGCSEVIRQAANDLQDYLFTSMGVSTLLIQKTAAALAREQQCVVLCEKKEAPRFGKGLKTARSYRLTVRATQVVVCGFDDRGAAQGSYHLEEVMNFREAPFLLLGESVKEPLFSPRMTHSGWGLDQFPDSHLNAIAHAGMDAILVVAKGVDRTPGGYLDFNDLVRRAKRYGLDVYFYSYLTCWKHPEDADAEAAYDQTFGALFRACPEAKGIVLVGESCEFPSRDERTTRRPWTESVVDGIPADKPSPGWWPCNDYAGWVTMVKTVVRKWSPQADIVFWTYNWGYAPEPERVKLIASLPTDISLLVTFEMFDQVRHEDVVNPVMDYTISYPGPGEYFKSEAAAASKKGLRLYAMTNTGGCTWDFGVTPYEPFPFQWAKRHAAMHEARKKWGLSGLMESHQYGFYPSFIADFTKWNFWSGSPSSDETLRRIAVRDFGIHGAPHALKAWECWSEAITHYIPTNEDQYGPNRIGPSYPLIFHPDITRTFTSKELVMNSPPFALNGGNAIVKTFYHPYENAQQSPGPQRIAVEIRSYRKAQALLEKGLVQMRQAIQSAPEQKRETGARQELLAQFMANTIGTTIHVKEWWRLNQRLLVTGNRQKAHAILDALVTVAQDEMANAQATIELVERDSRLGWEPTMDYMCDRPHLEWKIRQVRHVVENEIFLYRKMVDL
jgi:hypothetical protein